MQCLFVSRAPNELLWYSSSRYEASCELIAGWDVAQLAVLVLECVLAVRTKFGAHFLVAIVFEIRVRLRICC